MLWRLAAETLTLLHAVFVVFVVFGALLAVRWPRLVWAHLPAAVWGAAIEFGGWLCPLTPLENAARTAAGKAGYAEGFLDHYLRALIYPAGLTRELQLLFGCGVLVLNGVLYGWLWRRRRRRGGACGGS